MRTGGVEPPRAEAHTGLSRACLPIPITSAWWYGQESNPRLPGFNRALVPSQLPHRCIGTRRRRTDSNRRETGLQSAASPLGHDAAISSKVPGEGVEPKCHFLVQSQASYRLDDPGSRVRVLIIFALLQFPLSRRYRRPADVSPPAPEFPTNAPSSAGPRTPYGTCASPPQQRQGFPGVPREDSNLSFTAPDPGGRRLAALRNTKGDPFGRPHLRSGADGRASPSPSLG
jgi:hypothetical protein